MVDQIFYWTGVIVWWCLCIGLGGCLGIAFLYLPFYFFKISKKRVWRWRLYSEIAQNNINLEDIDKLTTCTPLPSYIRVKDLMNWFDSVQKDARKILKEKGIL